MKLPQALTGFVVTESIPLVQLDATGLQCNLAVAACNRVAFPEIRPDINAGSRLLVHAVGNIRRVRTNESGSNKRVTMPFRNTGEICRTCGTVTETVLCITEIVPRPIPEGINTSMELVPCPLVMLTPEPETDQT